MPKAKVKKSTTTTVKKEIMLVEDDAGVNQIVLDILVDSFQGHTVTGYLTKDTAVTYARKHVQDIGVVVTDGKLYKGIEERKEYGWHLLADLRKIGYTGPAIYIGTAEVPNMEKPNFYAILEKGNAQQLLDAVKQALSGNKYKP